MATAGEENLVHSIRVTGASVHSPGTIVEEKPIDKILWPIIVLAMFAIAVALYRPDLIPGWIKELFWLWASSNY